MHVYAINKVHKLSSQQRYTVLLCSDIKSAFPNLFQTVCLFLLLIAQFIVCHSCHLSLKPKKKKNSKGQNSSLEAQIIKKFMKREVSLPYQQESLTLPLAHLLSQKNPIDTLSSHLFQIHFNIILPSMPRFPRDFFLSGFPTKITHIFIIYLVRVTQPAHLILLPFTDVIIIIIIIIINTLKLKYRACGM